MLSINVLLRMSVAKKDESSPFLSDIEIAHLKQKIPSATPLIINKFL